MVLDSFRKPAIPRKFIYLHYLKGRMDLPPQFIRQYDVLHRGYLGEKKFHEKMSSLLPIDSLILYSLNLSYRDASYQLDSLLFLGEKIFHFEIKYFSGDYVVDDSNWYVARTSKEINNPLVQLERASYFIRQMSKEFGWHGEIDGRVVFMHDAFYLYGARVGDPIVFLPQLERFVGSIIRSERAPGHAEFRLAREFASRHEAVSRYDQLPEYDYDELWKGIVCPECTGRMEHRRQRSFVCQDCSKVIGNETVIQYNIDQLMLLFPEHPLTVGAAYEWCDEKVSKFLIRSYLQENFKVIKNGRGTCYVPKEE